VNLPAIQAAVREAELDGWLFYDFHNRDLTAYRILGLDGTKHASRRWYYWVPAGGDPIPLAHGVESTKLDSLPGEKRVYVTWEQLHAALGDILKGAGRIAMQYSPDCDIPYISLVDAGTVELVRSAGGVEIVSSADLVSRFEAVFGEAGTDSHRRAMEIVHQVKDEAFEKIGASLRAGERLTEFEIARFILDRFAREGSWASMATRPTRTSSPPWRTAFRSQPTRPSSSTSGPARLRPIRFTPILPGAGTPATLHPRNT
jgi:Xaa-Pro aminopeptidase